MAQKISKTGIDFIKGFESFVPHVYDDLRAPVKGKYREWDGGKCVGTLTVAYGHTNAAKHPLKIVQGLRVTEQTGCDILDVDLDECEEAVNRLVKVPLSQGQYDSLVSFGFNCGTGNLKKLIIPLNRGDYAGTRRLFGAYVKSKGQTLRGLQRRRREEQAMWDDKSVVPPTEPVHHPAEVDAPVSVTGRTVTSSPFVIPAADPPKVTTADVVAVSRKATWLVRFGHACKAVFGSLTLGALAEQAGVAKSTMDQVAGFVQQNAVIILITCAILGYFGVKYILSLMVEDVNEGRSVPSGKA